MFNTNIKITKTLTETVRDNKYRFVAIAAILITVMIIGQLTKADAFVVNDRKELTDTEKVQLISAIAYANMQYNTVHPISFIPYDNVNNTQKDFIGMHSNNQYAWYENNHKDGFNLHSVLSDEQQKQLDESD